MNFNLTPRQIQILIANIDRNGRNEQLGMAQEEAGELVSAVNQFFRGRVGVEKIKAEAADVLVTVAQLFMIFGDEDLDVLLEERIERLC